VCGNSHRFDRGILHDLLTRVEPVYPIAHFNTNTGATAGTIMQFLKDVFGWAAFTLQSAALVFITVGMFLPAAVYTPANHTMSWIIDTPVPPNTVQYLVGQQFAGLNEFVPPRYELLVWISSLGFCSVIFTSVIALWNIIGVLATSSGYLSTLLSQLTSAILLSSIVIVQQNGFGGHADWEINSNLTGQEFMGFAATKMIASMVILGAHYMCVTLTVSPPPYTHLKNM
jgi:hypothetical protein